MKEGMLWYDDNPGTSLEDKVLRAARHYKRTRKVTPNLCLVNPAAMPKDQSKRLMFGRVRVGALPTVLRHHFWMGVELIQKGVQQDAT